MLVQKILRIYKITHDSLNKSELVVAYDVSEAIEKFNKYYELDNDIKPEGILSINLEHDFIVIDEGN